MVQIFFIFLMQQDWRLGSFYFFDHAGKIKLNDDPTPFEVQMRLYERDVNDTLMINAGRKGEEADVDS